MRKQINRRLNAMFEPYGPERVVPPPVSSVRVLAVVVAVIATAALLASALIGRSQSRSVDTAAIADITSRIAAGGAQGQPVRSLRLITFADRADGGIIVRDATDGGTVAVLAPETNAFIRSVMRSLVRERRRLGLGDAAPFALLREPSTHQLSLTDMATGRRLELQAFGPSNFGAFATLLDRTTMRASSVSKME